MKNLFKVVAFAFIFVLGTGAMSAQTLSQDQDRPEVVAKKKADQLTSQLDLNGDQQRALFRAYTAYESNYKKYIVGKDANNADVVASKKKYDEALKESARKTLTEAQYKKWLTIEKL
ncbi:hypothetical protein [Altibacter sp.]|uniref:hypothetical protein n=1 Tax=Altibacter sp. TaxID=2024823 RepID=UPI000C8D3A74|nr:hypothetical protein [Altibacter sp.]MAP54527.1 hypothetical protein [Altibacter sp.]|tara:strand:- start:44 stop:394 length:351 start_codon:yes stop_codon:yes gene_type:complete